MDVSGYEFFRPLVTGWLSKIESALTCRARKKWKEVAEECLMFYGRSAAAMWDPVYSKKFWKGVKSPRFRITINKAFEYVAVFGPNLIWDVPHRTVTSKKILELPQELFPDPQQYQAIQQQIAGESVADKVVGHLLDGWLNYTPRETGLEANNELAVLDAMLKGAGTLWPSLLTMPASERTLTQCRYEKPEDLIFDPDFTRANDCKWIALRHIQPYWEVERRFKLPTNSLKNKATLESSWHYNEMKGTENSGQERKAGKTSDLVVWYEIWSKLGCGARMTGMADSLKSHLEEVVGDYAYLAICPDCPYPLNCPADLIRGGADSGTIARQFEWPVPLWTDNRWPVERLVFYEDPESPYGLAPLAPALGELKAINAIVSWLVNRTWISSRQMWAVLAQYHDDMKKQLEDGEDLAIFSLPPGSEDVKKVIQLFESKEVNRDAWEVLELLSNIFDKRMGMTPFVYGQNEGGTQDRTAETTNARKQAVGVRPEFMQKKVVEWQSRVASVEAILTWLYIRSTDVQPLLGNVGAMLWQQHIENADPELVMRQMRYEVAAASIRRPNRDRDIQNLNEVLARWIPEASKRAELTNDWQPINGAMKLWGDLHDMDVEPLTFPPPNPDDPNAQLDQQLKQAEVQKTQAEAQKAMAEAQANPMAEMQMEAQFKAQELQMEQDAEMARLQMEERKLEMELEAKKAEIQLKVAEKQIDMQFKAQEHQQNLQQQQAEGQVDLAVKQETGAQQIAMGRQQMRQSEQQHQQGMRQTAQQSTLKAATTKQQSDAKVSAMKAQAKAKPKPSGSKK